MNELQNISIPQSIAEIEEYLKQNRIQHIVGDIIEVALYIRVSQAWAAAAPVASSPAVTAAVSSAAGLRKIGFIVKPPFH